jgi:predicted enzyme related to lactoylglutathione lyase
MDLPNDAGRLAVCQDPEGAFFAVMRLGRHTGAQLVNEIGTWTWNQLASHDIEAAKTFYGDVFGWTLEPSPEAPPDSPYEMWQVPGQKWEEGLGGAMTLDQLPGEVPAHWMTYLCVESADGAIETIKSGGGQVMVEPQVIPVGKLAVVLDPQGAAFGIIEPDYPEPR